MGGLVDDQGAIVLFGLICSFLVFFMQSGFAMLETGIAQTTNVQNVLMKNFLDTCINALVWFVAGFAFAYGKGSTENSFIGLSGFFLINDRQYFSTALVIGPRTLRVNNWDDRRISGHNKPMAVLGIMLLWFSWYGFNAVSVFSIASTDLEVRALIASKSAVNTTLSAMAGGITCYTIQRLREREYDIIRFGNAVLSGLVAITGPCASVEPWAACVIGVIAYFVSNGASKLLSRFRIDDPLDAFPVHGAAGAWGLISAGLFSTKRSVLEVYGITENMYGLFYGGNIAQLGIQVLGVVVIFAWTGAWIYPIAKFMHARGSFRVSREAETNGVDSMKHGDRGYPEFWTIDPMAHRPAFPNQMTELPHIPLHSRSAGASSRSAGGRRVRGGGIAYPDLAEGSTSGAEDSDLNSGSDDEFQSPLHSRRVSEFDAYDSRRNGPRHGGPPDLRPGNFSRFSDKNMDLDTPQRGRTSTSRDQRAQDSSNSGPFSGALARGAGQSRPRMSGIRNMMSGSSRRALRTRLRTVSSEGHNGVTPSISAQPDGAAAGPTADKQVTSTQPSQNPDEDVSARPSTLTGGPQIPSQPSSHASSQPQSQATPGAHGTHTSSDRSQRHSRSDRRGKTRHSTASGRRKSNKGVSGAGGGGGGTRNSAEMRRYDDLQSAVTDLSSIHPPPPGFTLIPATAGPEGGFRVVLPAEAGAPSTNAAESAAEPLMEASTDPSVGPAEPLRRLAGVVGKPPHAKTGPVLGVSPGAATPDDVRVHVDFTEGGKGATGVSQPLPATATTQVAVGVTSAVAARGPLPPRPAAAASSDGSRSSNSDSDARFSDDDESTKVDFRGSPMDDSDDDDSIGPDVPRLIGPPPEVQDGVFRIPTRKEQQEQWILQYQQQFAAQIEFLMRQQAAASAQAGGSALPMHQHPTMSPNVAAAAAVAAMYPGSSQPMGVGMHYAAAPQTVALGGMSMRPLVPEGHSSTPSPAASQPTSGSPSPHVATYSGGGMTGVYGYAAPPSSMPAASSSNALNGAGFKTSAGSSSLSGGSGQPSSVYTVPSQQAMATTAGPVRPDQSNSSEAPTHTHMQAQAQAEAPTQAGGPAPQQQAYIQQQLQQQAAVRQYHMQQQMLLQQQQQQQQLQPQPLPAPASLSSVGSSNGSLHSNGTVTSVGQASASLATVEEVTSGKISASAAPGAGPASSSNSAPPTIDSVLAHTVSAGAQASLATTGHVVKPSVVPPVSANPTPGIDVRTTATSTTPATSVGSQTARGGEGEEGKQEFAPGDGMSNGRVGSGVVV